MRFYFCDDNGRILRFKAQDCDEAEAAVAARNFLIQAGPNIHAIEAWDRDRLVRRIARGDVSPDTD